ncbi:MAG: heavy-metal-associated domain-containing protein [Spirosomaceae bacterium]|nr:heavy-metal-associated domain-containing protein [Spirosomataceae bacterium]
MKSTIFSVIAILFISVFSVAFKVTPPAKVKIKTSAICEMCKERIEKQLAFTKGVEDANLDLKDKVVTISYNAKKTDVAKLKKAINDAGYDADETASNPKSYEKLPSCCKKDGEAMHH